MSDQEYFSIRSAIINEMQASTRSAERYALVINCIFIGIVAPMVVWGTGILAGHFSKSLGDTYVFILMWLFALVVLLTFAGNHFDSRIKSTGDSQQLYLEALDECRESGQPLSNHPNLVYFYPKELKSEKELNKRRK